MKHFFSFIFIFFLSFAFAQENEREIEQVQINDSVASNRNYTEFKAFLKPNVLLKRSYFVNFKGNYQKNGWSIPIHGNFHFNATIIKISDVIFDNENLTEEEKQKLSEAFKSILVLEYSYRNFTVNKFKDRFRCYPIEKNKWRFNLVSASKAKYSLSKGRNYFDVELSENGVIKNIESYLDGAENFSNHNIFSDYRELRKGIELVGTKAKIKSLKSNNHLEVSFEYH